MEIIATITPKYQVQIPLSLRNSIGLKHGKVLMKVQNGKIIIEPLPNSSSFMSLGGSLKGVKPKKNYSIEKLRDSVEYGE